MGVPRNPKTGGSKRRERALATRRRMLAAAYGLFCDAGYAATTMADIAAEADVAVQTLYFTFRTKGALLGEVLEAAVVGFEHWQGPLPATFDLSDPATMRQFHRWFDRFEAEPDATKALAIFLDSSIDAMLRTAPLTTSILAALVDPDARAVYELGEKRRAESYAMLLKILARKGGLASGVSVARATDVMLVVFSPSVAHALTERGWSKTACRRFFLDVLSRQVLAG